MTLRLLISISLFALALQKVCAQTADEFFHGGAQSYLSNNVTGARQEVDKGLKLFPEDVKLKKLDELLKQQQQQNQSQQNQSQSKQNQQQQKQEQQKQDEQRKQQQEQQKNQKPEQEKKGDEQKQKEQQTPPGEMTPEEAKQLLDSQKGDEMLLPASHPEKPHDREHPLKDW